MFTIVVGLPSLLSKIQVKSFPSPNRVYPTNGNLIEE